MTSHAACIYSTWNGVQCRDASLRYEFRFALFLLPQPSKIPRERATTPTLDGIYAIQTTCFSILYPRDERGRTNCKGLKWPLVQRGHCCTKSEREIAVLISQVCRRDWTRTSMHTSHTGLASAQARAPIRAAAGREGPALLCHRPREQQRVGRCMHWIGISILFFF